jgi:DNA-binding CsgD family transcriptional regulator
MLQRNLTAEEREEAEIGLRILKLSWWNDNPAFRQVNTMFLIPEGTMEQFRWYNDLQRVSTSPENAVEIQRTFYMVNVREAAATLKMPTLVLQAEYDAAVPFEQGRHTAAQIPDARFVTLESKNHVLLATEPAWPQFWEAFYGFLDITDEKLGDGEGHEGARTQEALFLELTPRELEVLRAMVHGYQNNEIARQLTLSPRTVRNYVSNIYSKLQVNGRREAVALALQRGINVDHEHP